VPTRVIALSGAISSGKTTLADLLAARFHAFVFKTKDCLLESLSKPEMTRRTLQEHGELLDRRTKGQWVVHGLARRLGEEPEGIVVVDAVRIREQVVALRRAYGDRVIHVHLKAPGGVLQRRYAKRKSVGFLEMRSYEEASRNKTEQRVRDLERIADVAVDTHRCTKQDVLVRVAGHLGLYGRECTRLVDVLVGGQYGSEGKGHMASFLANEYDVLVRVGGPNAGHKVYEEPRPYTFKLLPSGTRRNTESALVIGAGAVLCPQTLMREIADCQVDASRLSIDPQAMIITDVDRRREAKLVGKIGSTGQGVGQATARRILGRESDSILLARDVPDLRPFVRSACEVLDKAFSRGQKVLLEGTQGTGLSLYHGSYPHVTSRDTTVAGCLAEAGISPGRVRKVVMVCRTYPIRVGNPPGQAGNTSGPMSQELTFREIARRSGLPYALLRGHEVGSVTGRKRRVSEFDWDLLRRATSLNAPTDVALSFVDYLDKENEKARRFDQLTTETIHFIQEIERVSLAPVSLISTRFDFRSIIDRRTW
jgi:adenylosuccinate synthase